MSETWFVRFVTAAFFKHFSHQVASFGQRCFAKSSHADRINTGGKHVQLAVDTVLQCQCLLCWLFCINPGGSERRWGCLGIFSTKIYKNWVKYLTTRSWNLQEASRQIKTRRCCGAVMVKRWHSWCLISGVICINLSIWLYTSLSLELHSQHFSYTVLFFFLSSRKSHPLPRQQNCQSAWTKRSLLLCWIRFWEPFHHTTTKKRGGWRDPVTMKYLFEFDFLDSHIIHHSRCKEAHKTGEIHEKYHVQLLFSICQLTVNLNALCPEWLTQGLSHFIFHKGRKGGSLLLMFVSVWISRPLSSIFSPEQEAGKKEK